MIRGVLRPGMEDRSRAPDPPELKKPAARSGGRRVYAGTSAACPSAELAPLSRNGRSRQEPCAGRATSVQAAFRRRCPTEKPSWYAFMRIVPSVRFIDLAIFDTGVFSRECRFSSFRSSFVQILYVRFLALFAISDHLQTAKDTARLSRAEHAVYRAFW